MKTLQDEMVAYTQNVKSLHNTSEELCRKGVTIYRNGQHYDLNNLEQLDTSIETIAENLSKLCRYSGNTREFYSVAEHSVEVSRTLLLAFGNPRLSLAGLLHDASEAYINDLLYTVKVELKDSFYTETEDRLERLIFKRYDIEQFLGSRLIKQVDVQSCNVEFETLLSNKFEEKPKTLLPDDARQSFLYQYRLLRHLIDTYGKLECLTQTGSHKLKPQYDKGSVVEDIIADIAQRKIVLFAELWETAMGHMCVKDICKDRRTFRLSKLNVEYTFDIAVSAYVAMEEEILCSKRTGAVINDNLPSQRITIDCVTVPTSTFEISGVKLTEDETARICKALEQTLPIDFYVHRHFNGR